MNSPWRDGGEKEFTGCSKKDSLAPNRLLQSLSNPFKETNRRALMSDVKSYRWHVHFLQAISEPVDSPRLSRLVRAAETAISQRLQELRVGGNGSAEREAISEAFASLRYVRDEGMIHSTVSKNAAASAS
jgi:Uri superfamily endonuclease